MKKIILFGLLILINKFTNAQTETLPAGAFIINMGSTTPTVANTLKAYGLIWDVIKNNKAQVRWVISQSKAKDGIDFTYNAVNYSGGTFIIPAKYRDASVNAKITAAVTGGVIGVTTTSPLTVNVTYNLKYTPRWTFDFDNGDIAQGYLTNAGIPIAGFPMKTPADLNGCDDLFVMPHADPVWSTHNNLLTWNQNAKGWIWAACHAVSAMENIYNPANPAQQLNFLSNRFAGFGIGHDPGNTWAANSLVLWGDHADPLTAFTYANPNDPEMQFIGTLTGGVSANGSERGYMPYNATTGGAGNTTTWRASTRISAYDGSAPATNPNIPEFSDGLVATVAYGRAFGDNARGKVMYEAGHDHDGTTVPFVNAQRIFFNFSFLSTYDKDPVPAPTASSINITAGQTINLGLSVRSGFNLSDYNVYWTSTCGGTFSNAFIANPTFTAPSINPCGACELRVTITDACGRQFYETIDLTICPAPPVALDRTTATINNPPGTGPVAVGAVTPLAATDVDGSVVSYTITSLPPVSEGVLSITCPPTPTGATCTGGFANLTAAVLAANPGGIVLTPSQASTFRFDPADGFGGNATFNYTATDNHGLVDATPATYTIPVNPPPVAQDILTSPINSNAGPTLITPALNATDNGTVVSYTISTLPPASQGILYLNGVPLTVGQVLTPAEAAQISFAPSGTFIGFANFTYTATDNLGAVDPTPATVTIQVVNQPPVPQNITAPAMANPNGTGQTPIPTLNATDVDGTIASYTINTLPPVTQGVLYYFNGTAYVPVTTGLVLTPAQAAGLRFDPTDGFIGTASFLYSATDNNGLVSASPATYTIPVGIVPPIANNITNPAIYSGAGQTAINPLTGSDPDATDVIASFTVTTLPPAAQGVLYYDNGGTYVPVVAGTPLTPAQAATLRFDPANGATGNVVFEYTVTDDEGLTDASPAIYTIPLVNQPPVATNVTNPALLSNAGATSINPLAATDPDGTVATYMIATLPDPSKGVLLLSGVPVTQGQVLTPAQIALLQFDPAPGSSGSAVFTFTATDDQGATDATPATYTIPITYVPVPPTTDDKTNATLNVADGQKPISALTGADVDGTVVSFTINSLPPAAQGVLYLNGVPVTVGQVIPANLAGQLTFDPSGTYIGNAVFTYSSTDNEGNTDATPAIFTIPIGNNPPVADNITLNNVRTNSTLNIPSLTGSDVDGTIASYTISTLPTLGTLQVDLDGPGPGGFTNVTAGQVLTPAQAASLRILSGAVVGTSVFTYTTTDNNGAVDATPANYTIPISGNNTVNQPPTVQDVLNPTLNANAAQTTINPLVGTDVDGTIEDFVLLSIPPTSQGVLYYNSGTVAAPIWTAITEGGFILTPAQATTLRFDPSGSYVGNVNFTYTAHDNDLNLALNPATFTIPIINNPPVANNVMNASMPSSAGPTTISSLSATDADGTVATYTVTTLPLVSQGILYLDGVAVTQGQILTPAQAARLQFDPNAMFSGNASFTFTATDNLGSTDATPATFTIPVTNQPPVADDKISQIITNQIGTGQQPIPALTATDLDGTIASFTVSTIPAPANGVLYYFNGTAYVPVTAGLVLTPAQAATLQFDPADGFAGTATFTYTATDNSGNVDATPATYQIPVNTPPTTNNITAPGMYATQGNTAIPPFTGADNGFISFYSVTTLPPTDQGTLYLNGVAVTNLSQVDTLTPAQITQLSFTPAATFTGTTFNYTATDNQGAIDVTPAVYTIPSLISISGKVWSDIDGSITQNGGEADINGTNAGGGITTGAVLYVNLIDDVSGNVIATAPVQANGSYTFLNVPKNAMLTAQLTTVQGTIGSPKPATVLPSGWVNTGENKNGQAGFPDNTSNGEIIINTNNTIIDQQILGIEQLPNTDLKTTTISTPVLNQLITLNGGTNPPVLSGTDPEDCNSGCVLTSRSVMIDVLPANSELYYNSVLVTAGQLITNFDPALLQVKITAATLGSSSTSFQYSFVDAAGKKDPSPATYTLQWLTPLPAEGLVLTASLKNNMVALNLKTLSENNTDHFEIERGVTGNNFTTIGATVAAAGNSAFEKQYNSEDDIAAVQNNGVLYYRVKLYDQNGSFRYSNTATVRLKTTGIKVWPNPFLESVQVSIASDRNAVVELRLIDITGKTILAQRNYISRGTSQVSIGNLGNVPKGTYVLQVINTTDNSVSSYKLIKE
jgi:hypothetical protein